MGAQRAKILLWNLMMKWNGVNFSINSHYDFIMMSLQVGRKLCPEIQFAF